MLGWHGTNEGVALTDAQPFSLPARVTRQAPPAFDMGFRRSRGSGGEDVGDDLVAIDAGDNPISRTACPDWVMEKGQVDAADILVSDTIDIRGYVP